jgi:hypothetical protein
MSTLTDYERRSPRARQKRRERNLPLDPSRDDQMLTMFEWARLNRISERTARRILKSGKGPTVTRLSPKRYGISVKANRIWQQSRERV